MHIIIPDAAARPYQLIGLNYMFQPVLEQRFATLEELAISASGMAREVAQNLSSWLPGAGHAVRLKALSGRDKPLAIASLVAWGRRLQLASYRGRYDNFVFRQGSVSGISKWRGGSSVRNCQVQNERRSTAMVLREEGEVPARSVRLGRQLPDSWEGRRRIYQGCWKSQHKGIKSWDRPAQHGKKHDNA